MESLKRDERKVTGMLAATRKVSFMDRTSAAAVGESSRYAILAANVSKVISTSSGRTLDPVEIKLMERAAELLDKIVQGSQFIEHNEAYVLSDPRENLFTFDHAISALQRANLSENNKSGLTDIFALIKDDLHRIATSSEIEESRRLVVRQFFEALCELFYRDIADSSVSIQESEFETVSL
jgi:hypothetical protein